MDKRQLMIGLQSVMGVLALLLGLLTITGAVQLWQVYVLAVAARPEQLLREPGAPVVRAGDGRPGRICATR